MLSRVAEAFRSGLTLSERVKDGLAYKDAFDGREAVDLLCSLLDTDNRNLALLLGRALDFQKFFHDVTYDHRLRDSTNELYQFKRKVILPNAPFAAALGSEFADGAAGTPPGVEGQSEEATNDGSLPNLLANSSLSAPLNRTPSVFTTSENERSSISSLPTGSGGAAGSLPTSPGSVDQSQLQLQQQQAAQETDDLPSGVFTLLSVCYSPTCSSTSLCYSISCPLRIEQAKKLNMKPQPGLRKVASAESLKEDEGEDGGGAALWANSVSKAVLDGVDAEERKRQEAINELIFTERDFVKDMEYLRDVSLPVSIDQTGRFSTDHGVSVVALVLGEASSDERCHSATGAEGGLCNAGLLERLYDPRQQLVSLGPPHQAPAIPARRRVGRRHLPRESPPLPAVRRLRRPPGVRKARV